MKVIFLDFDGVLNSWRWYKNLQINGTIIEKPLNHIDPKAIKVLNLIIGQTGAKVVVSSTWRRLHNKERLQQILNKAGFIHEVIDTTPILNTYRGVEIQKWLTEHGPVESFVIIDDDSDMVHLKDRLVQTSMKDGLRVRHVDEIVRRLGQ